jgi:hypothetical protein
MHHGRYCVLQNPLSNGPGIACVITVHRLLAEGIAQNKPVILAYGTEHGDESAHRGELTVRVRGLSAE